MMSLDTLNLLAQLLSQVTISPNFDGFEQQALTIAKARRELLAAIEEASAPAGPTPT